MNKLSAIAKCKCPKCYKGSIFQYPIMKVLKFSKTNKYCPHCALRYERGPGFFDGAMYISYSFSVALTVIVGLSTFYIGNNVYNVDPLPWVYISLIVPAILLLSPFSFRYSRTLMLHLFGGIDYEPDAKAKTPPIEKNNEK